MVDIRNCWRWSESPKTLDFHPRSYRLPPTKKTRLTMIPAFARRTGMAATIAYFLIGPPLRFFISERQMHWKNIHACLEDDRYETELLQTEIFFCQRNFFCTVSHFCKKAGDNDYSLG